MFQKDAVFIHPKGMHIRAAAMLANKAYEIESMLKTSIYIRNKSGREVPATAPMAIHSLNIKPGERITIVARGPKANEAIESVEELFKRDLLPQSPIELEQVDKILEQNTIKADKIFDSIGLGIIVTNKTGTVILCNRIAEELIGISKNYILGCNIHDIIPGIDLATSSSMGIGVFRMEEDSKKKLASTDINPIFIDGELAGYSIVFNKDVSTAQSFSPEYALEISLSKDLQTEQKKRADFNDAFKDIIGQSDKFATVLEVAYRAAKTCSTVLIQGESGTWKELVAKSIPGQQPPQWSFY